MSAWVESKSPEPTKCLPLTFSRSTF